jgi:hypothetical protein
MTSKAFARWLLPVALLFAMSTVACSDDDSTGPDDISVEGTWTLQSVNGSNLPYVLAQAGADKVEVTADVLTVGSGGAFTELTTVRVTSGGTVTTQSLPDAGTYTVNGTAVTFVFQSDGSSGTGTLNGDRLTVATGGLSLVYEKQ